MADLGTIGTLTEGMGLKAAGVWYERTFHRLIRADLEELLFTRRWDVEGNPALPSQRQERHGILKDIYWPVKTGARTFKIRVKHSGHTPVPLVRIKAHEALGVLQDVTVTPTASTDWQELSVAVTVGADGVLWVWRELRSFEQPAYALWDHIAPT